ncbi:hypothetical protein KIN20_004040 [Parelaphostrongylus tenuis]|uniref:Uncharacterized protein n=1 Tax=Parelaphostrongylus tenuis TaxID=148309 RepID=A0AAD5QEU5_PARTN|nr:hypothetical protein KIN20_004040 [Parelaphostrongylus tenuis]
MTLLPPADLEQEETIFRIHSNFRAFKCVQTNIEASICRRYGTRAGRAQASPSPESFVASKFRDFSEMFCIRVDYVTKGVLD